MAFYEAGVLTTAPAATIDKMYCMLWNTGTTTRLRLREVGFVNTAATNSKVGIKRTTVRGTNTATLLGTPIDNNDPAASGTVDYTYSADPTVAGNYIRRGAIANVIGAGMQWSWWNGPGLVIPVSVGLAFVVPTAAAGGAQEAWLVWEEN